jgi:hypothetical protein
MIRSVKCTFVLIVALLFCAPCLASENSLRVFDTGYFTIKLPVNMTQLSAKKNPPMKDKDEFMYAFGESNKLRKKSILLAIIYGKIKKPAPNSLKDIALKEMAKGLQESAANDSKCRSRISELTETRIAGQKGYYFEKRSDNCVVTLERYWTTIKGNHALTIYLARPENSDDAVCKSIVKEIAYIKLR